MDQLEQLRHAAPRKIALSRESIPILQHDNEAKETKGSLGAVAGAPRGEIHVLHQVIVVRHPCPCSPPCPCTLLLLWSGGVWCDWRWVGSGGT